MKHHNHILLVTTLFLAHIAYANVPYKAVVIAPIADLVGAPIQTFFPNSTPAQAYDDLVVCGGTPAAHSYCPRLHQLLFNEIVTVVEEKEDEVRVKNSSCFYIAKDNPAPQHAYWMLKKNLVPFQELENKSIDINHFPDPITFEDPNSLIDEQVVTLALPWYDANTNQIFSAGTRFLRACEQQDSNADVPVHIFDPATMISTITIIPASVLMIAPPESIAEKIKLFVQVLKAWANPESGFIPYVLGGSSFTITTNKPALEKYGTCQGADCSYYEIQDFNHAPKPGFDCSNLITRAAQLAGIPFFFKNSLTIATYLKPLQPGQQLETGDIFWKKGHVIVVSDTEKNTVIEARGYTNGAGSVQEIELNKVFQNVSTCDDFSVAWRNKQAVERLGEDGTVIDSISDYKLLSLRSVLE